MATVGVSDFEAGLLQLLARVAQGERITIVQHGKPIAELVPVKSESGDYDTAVDRMIEFRRGRAVASVNLRDGRGRTPVLMAPGAAFVLDNSVTMAWCFPDEYSLYSDSVLQSLKRCGAIVPGLWALEVANILLVGERRNRIQSDDSVRFIDLLANLPIITDDQTSSHALMTSIDLGRKLARIMHTLSR